MKKNLMSGLYVQVQIPYQNRRLQEDLYNIFFFNDLNEVSSIALSWFLFSSLTRCFFSSALHIDMGFELIDLNLETFIAKDKNDYIEKAKIISSDTNKLSQIRYSLRNLAINSSLFDNKDFGLELCKILKDKWRLFSQQNKNL